MSVDMIMYKVNKLNNQDLLILKDAHFDDLDTLCPEENWDYKAYLKSDIEKRPERFVDILKYARLMKLRRTTIDYKQCYIDHGMPANVASYCCAHHSHEIVLRWDDNCIVIPHTDLERYTHEDMAEYYVLKINYMDVDVPNWHARKLMSDLRKWVDYELDYRPTILNKQIANCLSKSMINEYDEDNLYDVHEMAGFVFELMRAIVDPQKGVFIEFQD